MLFVDSSSRELNSQCSFASYVEKLESRLERMEKLINKVRHASFEVGAVLTTFSSVVP